MEQFSVPQAANDNETLLGAAEAFSGWRELRELAPVQAEEMLSDRLGKGPEEASVFERLAALEGLVGDEQLHTQKNRFLIEELSRLRVEAEKELSKAVSGQGEVKRSVNLQVVV